MAEPGLSPGPAGPAGLESARVRLRSAGYCVLCDRIVERSAEGGCMRNPEHPPEALTGQIVLGVGEPLPVLPRFNVAAFLVPPVWGPANGQWAGAIFLPMWLFMDSVIASASGRGGAVVGGATLVVAATIGAQAWFGKRANGLAWRRVSDRMSVDEFSKRQRLWAVASVPLFLLLFGWGVYYRIALSR